MKAIAYQHRKDASNIFTQAPRKYAGQLKTFPRHLLSDAMCLVENLHQKAEDSGGFDLDASPILRSVISRSVKTVLYSSQLVVSRCDGGEWRS